jgi:septum formation protein
MRLNTDFILASSSPRRKKLLELIGLPFTVQPSPVEETIPLQAVPDRIVRSLAKEKAEAVASRYPWALTLGADTIVVLDGEILGKPDNPEQAEEMLRRLSDATHTVFTGIALVHPDSGRSVTAHEETRVTFGPMEDAEIVSYVASGAPLDKAGAYGIQDDRGALYIARIDGDYYNVVGLPLHRLYRLIRSDFADLVRNGFS